MDGSISAQRRFGFGLLAGASLALGWAALSVLVGSPSAQAAEPADPSAPSHTSSLLSTVSETVAGVASPVESAVAQTVQAVTEAVSPSVGSAPPAAPEPAPADPPATDPAPAPDEGTAASEPIGAAPVADVVVPAVAAPVAPATAAADTVSRADHAVAAVAQKLGAALAMRPVTTVASPVVDGVCALPLIGDLLGRLGVPPLVGDVTGAVDDVVGTVGSTVGSVVDGTTGRPPVPGLPDLPGLVDPASPAPVARLVPSLGPASAAPSQDRPTVLSRGQASGSSGEGVSGPLAVLAPTHSTAPSTPGVPPAGTGWGEDAVLAISAAGSGAGSAPFSSFVAAAANAHNIATGRTAGASDDTLPTSPVSGTDVAPD